MDKDKYLLSVIVLNWNTRALLDECLSSLQALRLWKQGELEIIVVDNGSQDDSVKMLRRRYKGVVLIENKKNLGFARGNNIGLRAARGRYIMLLNSDTRVEQGALNELIIFLRGKINCAASPMLLNEDGSQQTDYYSRFPNIWHLLFYHNRVLRSLVFRFGFLRNLLFTEPDSKQEPFRADQLPGAALAASREVWSKVGFLDEDYGFLYEDVDWCYRAMKLKIGLWVVPSARIFHKGGGSWRKLLKDCSYEYYQQYFGSMMLFVSKNYSQAQQTIFVFALFWHYVINLVANLLIFRWKKVRLYLKLIAGLGRSRSVPTIIDYW